MYRIYFVALWFRELSVLCDCDGRHLKLLCFFLYEIHPNRRGVVHICYLHVYVHLELADVDRSLDVKSRSTTHIKYILHILNGVCDAL
jgi:hypothetical protein